MANSEAEAIREFRDDFVKYNQGKAYKISDQFLVGVVDVFAQAKFFGGCWMEWKFLRRAAKSKKPFPVALTEKQRQFIKEIQMTRGQNGAFAGWVLCVKLDDGTWRAYAGCDPEVDEIFRDAPHVERRRGQAWDTGRIMELCKNEHHTKTSTRRPPKDDKEQSNGLEDSLKAENANFAGFSGTRTR